jgi:hypothetical protein
VRYIIRDESVGRDTIRTAWAECRRMLRDGLGVKVTVAPVKATRTIEQNRILQSMCADVARQVEWHGQHLSHDDWRHMFVAAYRKQQRIVPGIDGGFVVLGASSRDLSIAECSEVMELVWSFGAERDVTWSPTSVGRAA